MVKGWGSEGFLRYKAFNEVKGVEHAPRGNSLKPPGSDELSLESMSLV